MYRANNSNFDEELANAIDTVLTELSKSYSTNCNKCNSLIIYDGKITKSDKCYCVRCFDDKDKVIEELKEKLHISKQINKIAKYTVDNKDKQIEQLQKEKIEAYHLGYEDCNDIEKN